MDSAKEQLKVLLMHQPATTADAEAWLRVEKALKTIGHLDRMETDSLSTDDLRTAAAEYSHVFLDFELAHADDLADSPIANLTLTQRVAFDWNNLAERMHWQRAISLHSSLFLDGLSAADLVRALHLYLATKRMAGVTPLLEKGSLVVAEKVQSMDTVGTVMDRLSQYLSSIEGFALGDRILDLRQALTSLIAEGFLRAQEAGLPYPTVEFQFGASSQKAVVNLRFPRGNLNFNELSSLIFTGRSLAWQNVWQSADLSMLTHHVQYDEVEAMLLLRKGPGSSGVEFHSLLVKKSERSLKKDNLLAAPQNFEFRLLADVRVNQQDQVYTSAELSSEIGIDLGSLPEAVVKKLDKLSEEREFFSAQAKKKSDQVKEAALRIVEANKEISQKRSELLRVTKTAEAQTDSFQRKISALEKRISQQQALPAFQAATKESTNSTQGTQEALTKAEAGLRAAENEKHQLVEKLANEQKKVTSYEQRYTALHKDLSARDVELREIKGQLLKARKELAANAASSGAAAQNAGPNQDGLAAKLKESEANEISLKQELKKAAFKAETTEKHMKASQNESTEKIKLLEQKLQGAKAKEVELLKKVEELMSALKKASKAA